MKHPYEYITKDNFDIIRGCIVQGLTLQKKPQDIVMDLVKIANLPEEVAKAIVSQEVGTAFDVWKDRKDYNEDTTIK